MGLTSTMQSFAGELNMKSVSSPSPDVGSRSFNAFECCGWHCVKNFMTPYDFEVYQHNVNAAHEHSDDPSYWPQGLEGRQVLWSLKDFFSDCWKKYDPSGRKKIMQSMLSAFDLFSVKVERTDNGKHVSCVLKCSCCGKDYF